MAKKSLIGKILHPSDSGSIIIFFIGMVIAGVASGIGSQLGGMLFKGTMRKVDANIARLPPEYRKEFK